LDKILTIGLLLCLIVIIIQDWKYRKIHVALPVIVFIISFFAITQTNATKADIIIYNLIFFLITLAGLVAYMSIKNRKFLNPFENYFGFGDLLFYVAVTPLFLLENYVIFFIFSLVFAIVLQILLKKIIQEKTVPLAGFASFFLLFLIIKDVALDFKKITLL